MNRFVEMEDYLQDYRIQRSMLKREKLNIECNCFTDSLNEQVKILIEEQVFRQEDKSQGAVKYIIFCNLLSDRKSVV